MGSKKNRAKMKLESQATKVRRAEELRELFARAENPPTETPRAATHLTDVSYNHTLTAMTPTPTATLPTNNKTRVEVTRRSPPPLRELPTVIHSQPYRVAARVDLAAKERDRKTAWWLGPALLVAAVFMLGIAWYHVDKALKPPRPAVAANPAVPSAMDQSKAAEIKAKIESQVKFYRHQLGLRLNLGRVGVELENQHSAPALADEKMSRRRDMLAGVPLMPEGYGVKPNRERIEPMHPDHPDARIMYGLQDEQDRDAWQTKADKTYIDEFVENARSEGYRVKLDADLNVISVEPLDASAARLRPSLERSPGSAR